jgi:hypothetical protein
MFGFCRFTLNLQNLYKKKVFLLLYLIRGNARILLGFYLLHTIKRTIYKSQAETGEIKGHYLNATAGTCEEMIKRAVFARIGSSYRNA